MGKISVGKAVPSFDVAATGNKTITLSDLKGRNLVLYFYPKDNTPGCTREGQDFRDRHETLKKLKTVVLGVSRDSLSSHDKFKIGQCFPFDLISDPDEKLCKLFDVIQEKNMYGKKVLGVERSTFLIDKEGVLRREWRRVKVEGHVAEVIAAIREL
ncbi:MAG: peroxiredoxin [Chromatiales bacterium]